MSAHMTQRIIEAVLLWDDPAVRVGQKVLEVLIPSIARTDLSAAVNGVALTFPGSDTNSDTGLSGVARRNRLSGFFWPKPGSNVVIHVTTGLNDGGNVGVLAVDGTDDHFQAAPAAGNNYTFTLSSANGYKAYFVYSFLTSTYRAGLTGNMTFDHVDDAVGAVVSQRVTEVLLLADSPAVRATQAIMEVLYVDTSQSGAGGSGGNPGGAGPQSTQTRAYAV